jgi:hypothetical protein
MKRLIQYTLGTLVCAAALVCALPANAINIDVNDDYHLGSFTPPQPAGDQDEYDNVQNLIDLWNGNGGSDPFNGRTFTLSTGAGSAIPTPAPNLTGWGTQQPQNGHTYQVSGAEYILGKFSDDIAHLWYVGGLTEVTLPSNIQGLSHITRFNATSRNVPDGGATLALLGLSLLGVGALRQRSK